MSTRQASVATCFFLRYLTGEPPDQAAKAERVLRRAMAGKIELIVPEMVIVEIVWTLETSVFNLSKQEASEKAIAILNIPGVQVPNGRILEEAAVLHAQLNIDFTDAYLTCFCARKRAGRSVHVRQEALLQNPVGTHRIPLTFITLSSALFVITC